MQAALKLTARVLPGHRIEIVAPELPEGTNVELIILPELSVTPVNGSGPKTAPTTQESRPYISVVDFLNSLPPSTMTAADWEQREREIQEEKNSWGD